MVSSSTCISTVSTSVSAPALALLSAILTSTQVTEILSARLDYFATTVCVCVCVFTCRSDDGLQTTKRQPLFPGSGPRYTTTIQLDS